MRMKRYELRTGLCCKTTVMGNSCVSLTTGLTLVKMLIINVRMSELECWKCFKDVDLTEKLDYLSGVALLGFSLILAVLRVFNVRDEAARVMVSAPLVAFVTTHILYLNCYQLDYVKMMYDCCGSLDFMNVSKWSGVERLILLDHIAGLNMKVCLAMGMLQLILWAVWAGVTCHPSRWKLWVVVIGGGLASLLEIYDFPPYMGFVDAHALWHGTTIPSTHLWWSFVRGDSEFRTTTLIKKAK
ncbi:hypothetical protein T459_09277 [Capsicum annuum]|uniref:Post-GPI attachment to proteins factor 3 n=1 Tax=Capsicum annuum TaxID=4072 RepID=A0A2G2ZYY9_CAPAN|nr:hypothetical protein FXO37_12175 [Capsicum annuum]PHT87171.1 hypothetical protein T459_09277 [Capsicum annuum]